MSRDEKTKTGEYQVVPLPGGASAPDRRPYLMALAGPQAGQLFQLEQEAMIGRGDGPHVALTDEGVSPRHCRIRAKDDGFVIEDLGSVNGTHVRGVRITSPAPLEDGDRIQLGGHTVLKLTFQDALEAEFHRKQQQRILRDPLTGLYDAGYLGERISSEIAYAARHGAWLALLLVDVDRLKHINQSYGPLSGDRVLRWLAERIRATCEADHVCARLEGGTFAVLIHGAAPADLGDLATRIRERVSSEPIEVTGKKGKKASITVTVSIGIAPVYIELTDRSRPPDMTAETMLDRAGQALRSAKDAGGDQVAAAE